MRRLCAAVLGFEAIMIALAIPVAITLVGIPPVSAALIWGGLAFAALLLSGLLRFRWAYVAGTLLQVLVTATGIIVPAMFVLGLLFGLLWVWGLRLGLRTDAMKRAEEAERAKSAASPEDTVSADDGSADDEVPAEGEGPVKGTERVEDGESPGGTEHAEGAESPQGAEPTGSTRRAERARSTGEAGDQG